DATGGVRLWTIAGQAVTPRALLATAHKEGPVWSLAFSPDGKILATAGPDLVIKLWNVGSEKPTLKTTVLAHAKTIYQLAFAADGQSFAALLKGENEEMIAIRDRAGNKLHDLEFNHHVDAMTFIDAHHLATTNEDSVYLIRVKKD